MIYQGNAVSKGIARGKVFIYKKEIKAAERRNVEEDKIEEELARLDSGLSAAKREILQVISLLEKENSQEAKIFKAHGDILQDVEMLKMIRGRIREKLVNAEWAVEQVYDEFISLFASSGNSLTEARAQDMKDVRQRFVSSLTGGSAAGLSRLGAPCIIAASDLLPSDTAAMDRENVLAIVTETGGETSHTAILAKSFEIPAVLGIEGIPDLLEDGEEIIVDALEGCLITKPGPEEKQRYDEARKNFLDEKALEQRFLGMEAVTKDGKRIQVKANIGSLSEGELKAAPYTDGVGLLRTEFLYMQTEKLPGENEQYNAYSNILGAYRGKPVILRTIDVGGDKKLPGLAMPEESNPFLGCRALRLCFAEPDLFRIQLRAAIRASRFGELWIMFPMAGCMEDIRKAGSFANKAREELLREGAAIADNIRIGVMIEIPAIALIADQVVKEVDFASIGTNDLCQYLMAADRMNPNVSSYYQSCHPAMLRLIRGMAGIFREHGKPLGVCGEMASDTMLASLLLGLGISSLSVNVSSLASIKRLVCGADLNGLKKLADHCCDLPSAEEVNNYCREYMERV
jgi:phosphotransferase system enzyme I (PtsI)